MAQEGCKNDLAHWNIQVDSSRESAVDLAEHSWYRTLSEFIQCVARERLDKMGLSSSQLNQKTEVIGP